MHTFIHLLTALLLAKFSCWAYLLTPRRTPSVLRLSVARHIVMHFFVCQCIMTVSSNLNFNSHSIHLI